VRGSGTANVSDLLISIMVKPQHQRRLTMNEVVNSAPLTRSIPWNKGKVIGAKPPLGPKHVWSIRTKLHVEGRLRDLAIFNLAIDSKLRGCYVVALKVNDIAPGGHAVDRATVRQRKTGLPVRFELTEATRQSVDDYLRTAVKSSGDFLFPYLGIEIDDALAIAEQVDV